MKWRIHPLFWLVATIAIATGRFYELLIVFLIIIVHEMGHFLVATHFKWRIKKVQLLPFGGVLEVEESGNRPWHEEWWVTIAGPLQQIWLAFVMWGLALIGVLPDPLFAFFVQANIMIAFFNLLPIYPLDGGKLILLLCNVAQPFLEGYKRTLILSFVTLSFFALFTLFIAPTHLNGWVIILYLYFILSYQYKHRHFVFQRFLMDRYYGQHDVGRKIVPLKVDIEETILQVSQRFSRGVKHAVIVIEDGVEVVTLDENEILHSMFTEKRPKATLRELVYFYG